MIVFAVCATMLTVSCGKNNQNDNSEIETNTNTESEENPYGEDLYEYINGEWINSKSLGEGEYICNSFSEAEKIMKTRVYDYLEELSKEDVFNNYDKKSIEYKLASMYKQIKESKSNDVTINDVKEILDGIQNISSFDELQQLYNSEEYNIFNRIISIDVDNRGGRGTYNICIEPIDLYNIKTALTSSQSEILLQNIKEEFERLGYSKEEANRIATEAVLLNTSICNYYGAMNKNYSFIRKEGLDSRKNNISINNMLESLGYVSENNIVFIDENYLALLKQLYVPENLEMIKSYHMVSVVHTLIPVMKEEIYTIYDSTDEEVLNSTYKADEMQFALNMLAIMPDSIEKIYTEKYISQTIKDDLKKLSEDIREIFIKRIDSNDWMETTTKVAAKKKLENIYVYAGDSGDYHNYTDVEIEYMSSGENIVDNFINILISNKNYTKSKLDKVVEKDKVNTPLLDANLYKQISTNEYAEYLAMVDSHLPAKFRVNYIVNQFQEFYDTYNIEEGSLLFLKPEDRINIF